jgi:hypothetical protein
MPIPFPPPGCKTAYIRDSAVLIVPEGASLAPLCVKCGKPEYIRVSKTLDSRGWQPRTIIDVIVVLLLRIGSPVTTVSIDIPLCRAHRSKQMRNRWIGAGLIVIGLASLPFSYRATAFSTFLEMLKWSGTLAFILAGLLLLFFGVHILGLIELTDQFAAYTGFGIEYMQKIPSETEIFSARRSGVTFNA